jgi:hypothetical protein
MNNNANSISYYIPLKNFAADERAITSGTVRKFQSPTLSSENVRYITVRDIRSESRPRSAVQELLNRARYRGPSSKVGSSAAARRGTNGKILPMWSYSPIRPIFWATIYRATVVRLRQNISRSKAYIQGFQKKATGVPFWDVGWEKNGLKPRI